jgi:hypothetical protein
MTFKRLSAWSGVIFAVLIVAASFVSGETPPRVTDDFSEVAEFFADNHDQLLFGNFVISLAGIFYVLFFVGLYQRLRPVERSSEEPWALVGLLGAIFLGVGAIVGQTASSVAILRAEEGTDISAVFNDLAISGYALGGIAFALTLSGFGFALQRAAIAPPWLRYLGYAGSVLGIVGAASAGSTSEVLATTLLIAFLVFALWVLILGVWLDRTDRTPAVVAPPA